MTAPFPHPAAGTPEIRSAALLEADLTRAVEDHWSASVGCSGTTWRTDPCLHGEAVLLSCSACARVIVVAGDPSDGCLLDFQRRTADPTTRILNMETLL